MNTENIPKDVNKWLKAQEYDVYCEPDCQFLKNGYCTFYNDDLIEEYGYYIICEDCYEANHAKV